MKVVGLAVDAAARRIDRDRRGLVTQRDLAQPQTDLQPTVLPAAEPVAGLLALPMIQNEAATEFVQVAELVAVIEGVRDFTIEAVTQPTRASVPDAPDDADAEPPCRFPHGPLCELGPWYQSPPSPEQTLLAIREAELSDAKQQSVAWTREARELEAKLRTERSAYEYTRGALEAEKRRSERLERAEAELARLRESQQDQEDYFRAWIDAGTELEQTQAALAETRRELDAVKRDRALAERKCSRPQSPLDALSLAEMLYPNRLVFSPRSRKSAADSAFRDGVRVFEVLTVIAMTSKNPSELRARMQSTFGCSARWRSSDSKPTATTFAASRRHTNVRGEATTLSEHITLGHGEKPGATLQIYILRLGDGRIEIAHCGDHLETVAVDT